MVVLLPAPNLRFHQFSVVPALYATKSRRVVPWQLMNIGAPVWTEGPKPRCPHHSDHIVPLCATKLQRKVHAHFRNQAKAIQVMRSVQFESLARQLFLSLAILSLASITPASQSNNPKPSSWSGILVSSSCNADEAFAESPECTKNVPGAKLALYDDTNRVMYSLEPQESVTPHLGDTVTVRGTLNADTIHVASVALMSIGLAAGQKAPAFAARDQFGRVQTLDTLKGANGTVLLFFRSADW